MVTRQQMREAAAAFGREGGKARAQKLTKEQRSESARKASEARWAQSMKRIDKHLAEIDRMQKDSKPRAKKIEKLMREVTEGTKLLEKQQRKRKKT